MAHFYSFTPIALSLIEIQIRHQPDYTTVRVRNQGEFYSSALYQQGYYKLITRVSSLSAIAW